MARIDLEYKQVKRLALKYPYSVQLETKSNNNVGDEKAISFWGQLQMGMSGRLVEVPVHIFNVSILRYDITLFIRKKIKTDKDGHNILCI